MTMGLLSLDQLKLRIKLLVGSPEEKKAAKQILPLIESHHFLLCTLLLFNAVANEALPVFLDDIVPSWAAVVIAVTAVLICGEILPTALFTGPKQLQIAAKFSGLVYFLQVLFYPVAYPMSLGLDKMLGDEDEENFNRDEISAMMQILRDTKSNDTTKQALTKLASGGYHNNNDEDSVGSAGGVTHNPMSGSGPPRDSSDQQEDPLSSSEVDVITGVLALAKKTIRDVYIPLDKVNMLSSEQLLSAETIEAIDQVGHSRLPVFLGSDTSHILGFLLVKRLITVNPEKALPLVDFNLIQPIIVG
jgi:metal transporter CNNM